MSSLSAAHSRVVLACRQVSPYSLHFLVPHLIRQLLCDADLALDAFPIDIGMRTLPAPGPIVLRALLQRRQGLPGYADLSLILGAISPIVSMFGRAQWPATRSHRRYCFPHRCMSPAVRPL
jgi:hypothetical protein